MMRAQCYFYSARTELLAGCGAEVEGSGQANDTCDLDHRLGTAVRSTSPRLTSLSTTTVA